MKKLHDISLYILDIWHQFSPNCDDNFNTDFKYFFCFGDQDVEFLKAKSNLILRDLRDCYGEPALHCCVVMVSFQRAKVRH
jgi:hypothetical protein